MSGDYARRKRVVLSYIVHALRWLADTIESES